MSGTARRTFELIDDGPPTASAAQAAPAPAQDQAQAARQLLFTALRALSARAATAITNLFSLFLVGLVAALLWKILDNPTENRLIGVGGFAAFCLLIDIVRRRS